MTAKQIIVRHWKCVVCGSYVGGGITNQRKNSGIAGYCRFCGPNVPARLEAEVIDVPESAGNQSTTTTP